MDKGVNEVTSGNMADWLWVETAGLPHGRQDSEETVMTSVMRLCSRGVHW